MVRIALKASCRTENIGEISTCGATFQWHLKFQCLSCNETDEKWHSISETEEVECKTGRSTCNFQMKCKFCSNTSSLDIVKDSIKPLKVNENGIVKDHVLAVFDCRGLKPVEFDPRNGWVAKNTDTGSVFNDVDFTDDPSSWFDCDGKGMIPVSIDEFSAEFVRL